MSAPPPRTWSALHSDVLLVLFSSLEIKSLGRCARVCRRWRALAASDKLWLRWVPEKNVNLGTGVLRPVDVVQLLDLLRMNPQIVARCWFNPVLHTSISVRNCLAIWRLVLFDTELFHFITAYSAKDRQRLHLRPLERLVTVSRCIAIAITFALTAVSSKFLLFPPPLLLHVPLTLRLIVVSTMLGVLCVLGDSAVHTGRIFIASACLLSFVAQPRGYLRSLVSPSDIPYNVLRACIAYAPLHVWGRHRTEVSSKLLSAIGAYLWPLSLPLMCSLELAELLYRRIETPFIDVELRLRASP